MRLNRWVYAAGALGMVSGALVEQACTPTNYCDGSGASAICYIYAPSGGDAGGSGSGTSTGSTSHTTGTDASPGDGGVEAAGPPLAPFGPGDGGPCSGPIGGFPNARCDPSDEMACMPPGSACPISPQCGDPNTCEPFTTNPVPGKGIDNFRMRLINLTAPQALSNAIVQGSVVTAGVDLPADGGACGENGTGLFNWLISVDQANKRVITGGAPPSTDPFNVGFCFVRSEVAGKMIAPINVAATFQGTTFSTVPVPGTLSIPIFVPGGGAVILPINGASLNDVTVSPDGNCIGSVNNNSISPSSSGPCTDPSPAGSESCSRWHSAGTLGGYITLEQADNVPVVSIGGESLCVLLTGQSNGMSGMANKCPKAALTAGNYCSTTLQAGGCNDSVWLSAQFAASAVKINDGTGVALCGNGSGGGTGFDAGGGGSGSGSGSGSASASASKADGG